MKVILLGTGGYYPTRSRHTACMMLPELGIVLDAGSGICELGHLLQTRRLDIFLTHAHLDHVLGLTYLLNLLPDDVQAATTVHGEADKLDAVREHLFAKSIFPVAPQFAFAALDGAVPVVAGGHVTYFSLVHPGGSIGYRLEWPGHSLAYVTDTTAAAGAPYVDAIRNVDLLIHEAYVPAADAANNFGHSSLLEAARVAFEANVGRLVIVHIDPQIVDRSAFDIDGARQIFPETQLGFDGMELEF